jgi:cell division protease FtsH
MSDMTQSRMRQYSADHRFLLDLAAEHAGLADPVVINLGEFHEPLLLKAKKREFFPVDGVLVRDWDPSNRREFDGVNIGMRVYEIEGIRFVRVLFGYSTQQNNWAFVFTAVGKADYRKLYRVALRCRRDSEPPSQAPVLPQEQTETLWQNTIGYLEGPNLRRIKAFGGRARRGILLMGPPGNGKTSACRWIWQECRRRLWEWRLVTPDAYRHARGNDSIEQLFSVERRGIVFFDDMDLALRDRETVHESEDQAVFLSALDGIEVNEGVVFVFTTNCALELIDRAFKRPGRIDLVLEFNPPNAALRRELMERWHPEIRAALDLNSAVASTDGFSFAEVEEIKNLLIMHYMECDEWNWHAAVKQLEINRKELTTPRRKKHVGFGQPVTDSNGGAAW